MDFSVKSTKPLMLCISLPSILVEQLAIRLRHQKTMPKSLVISRRRAGKQS